MVRLTGGWVTGTEGHRSCALTATIRVELIDSGGVEARGQWKVGTVMHPWSAVVRTWAWRNWCNGPGDVTVKFSLLSGTSVSQRVSDTPTCIDGNAATTLTELGTGSKYVRPYGSRIPPHLLPRGTPPPLHWDLINPRNGWIVSDGYSLVAVYAGSPGGKPTRGRLAIIRQNLIFGIQFEPHELVDVPKAGALTITDWPRGAARETTAQHGRLHFVSTRGVRGVLDLREDRVRIVSGATP